MAVQWTKPYEERYGCSRETVVRMRKGGVDLENPEAVAMWNASRKVRNRTGKQSEQAKEVSPGADIVNDEPGEDVLAGAEHELSRLADQARRAHQRLQTALGDGNPVKIKFAFDFYMKIAEGLLRYDRQVAADRRDSGETITRAQTAPMLTTMVVWFRRAVEDFINGASLQIVELDSPQGVYTAIAPMLRQSVGNAVDAATNDGKLPGWVREALVAGL